MTFTAFRCGDLDPTLFLFRRDFFSFGEFDFFFFSEAFLSFAEVDLFLFNVDSFVLTNKFLLHLPVLIFKKFPLGHSHVHIFFAIIVYTNSNLLFPLLLSIRTNS